MSERKSLIEDAHSGLYTHTELCQRYGISRKTGYKWLQRYEQQGQPGLADRSRAAHHHPNETPPQIIAALVQFKHQHPKWGPYAILHHFKRTQPHRAWPALSTVKGIFRRLGLSKPSTKRRAVPPHTEPLRHAITPYAVWSADYKGDFQMGNAQRCYPLTLSDNYSRFLIACQGMHKPSLNAVQRCYQSAFEQYGLPEAIRTDNGYPFASCGLGGLNPLSIWLLKLGVMPERIAPGCPQQNPRHERMHRTLKHFTIDPPKGNLSAQQRAFNQFREEYNFLRPHQTLHGDTPADWFCASPRPWPGTIRPVQYDEAFEVRKVRHDGYIKWKGRSLYLCGALASEPVGLKRIGNDLHQIYFAKLVLGVIDCRLGRIITPS